MSRLEELEEALYGKDDLLPAGRGKRQGARQSSGRGLRTSWEGGDHKQHPGILSHFSFSKMTGMVVLASVLFIVGAGVFALVYLGVERREAKVEIRGGETVEAGALAAVPISFKNTSSAPLNAADLVVVFPPDTLAPDASGRLAPAPARVVRQVGTVAPGEEQSIVLQAVFFGKEGEEKRVEASLLYRPGNIRARFSSDAEKTVKITRVPLAISWEVAERVSAGEEADVTIRVSSQARAPFENLWLRVDAPPGFAVARAVPAASSTDAVWHIGALLPGEEKKIVLAGTFSRAGGETQALRAGLGAYNELTKEWKPWRESSREVILSASPFLLEGMIDGKHEGIIKPGEFLSMTVRYRNQSPAPVKNVTVRAAVEGKSIDASTLTISDGGVFDGTAEEVVWGPGGTGALREVLPGQEGELHLAVRVKERPVVQSAADRNFMIRLRTRIDAASLPQGFTGGALAPEDTAAFKLSTVVLIAGRSAYRTSPLPNTGPLPPKVGEKTTYAVVWEVRNFTNEIENAEFRAPLPPNVRWEGAVSPRDADVRFDASSAEVRWRIGRVAPGTGVLTPGRVAAFQVSIVPSALDIGRSPALTGQAVFSGRDTFTGEDIAIEMQGVSTQVSEDPLVKNEEWAVMR